MINVKSTSTDLLVIFPNLFKICGAMKEGKIVMDKKVLKWTGTRKS
jgi:hypothetical protein